MWLIFSSYSDLTAHWAYQGLSTLGLKPLTLVLTESLVNTRLWEHRIGRDETMIRITLPNGKTVSSAEIRGVINRVTVPGAAQTENAAPGDREYANAEMSAFYMSWLYSLPCPVINRATPQGLCGRWRHNSEWVALAVAAGLATLPYRQSSGDRVDLGYQPLATPAQTRESVVVLNGKVFGDKTPSEIERKCIRLAQLAGLDTLGIDLVATPECRHVFAGATPMPAFERCGTPLLEQLLQSLSGTGGVL